MAGWQPAHRRSSDLVSIHELISDPPLQTRPPTIAITSPMITDTSTFRVMLCALILLFFVATGDRRRLSHPTAIVSSARPRSYPFVLLFLLVLRLRIPLFFRSCALSSPRVLFSSTTPPSITIDLPQPPSSISSSWAVSFHLLLYIESALIISFFPSTPASASVLRLGPRSSPAPSLRRRFQ